MNKQLLTEIHELVAEMEELASDQRLLSGDLRLGGNNRFYYPNGNHVPYHEVLCSHYKMWEAHRLLDAKATAVRVLLGQLKVLEATHDI